MTDFTVYFKVNSIVSLTVNANNLEEALKKAQEKMDKGKLPFRDELDYVDGRIDIAGVNDDDQWNLED